MLSAYHPANFEILKDHPITRLAKEQLPDLEPFVYHCRVTGFFGIGFFPKPEVNPHRIWPEAIRGVRVFKELVSLGQDLGAVTPDKIVELRQRMQFNAKEAQEAVREFERKRLEDLHEAEKENQRSREWLTQTVGHAAPTGLWNRRKIRFSFGGKGGKAAKRRMRESPSGDWS